MNIPARFIRAVVQDIPGLRPILSPRQQRTRELILKAATETFAHLGRRHITMRALSGWGRCAIPPIAPVVTKNVISAWCDAAATFGR